MAKQVLQRLSFTAGELTPWLAGRADLDPVSRGASRLINFLVSPFGGLRRRPGTRLVARAGCREGMVRLVSFKYSTGVQFMLEVGRGYVRYFKNGALLTDTEGGVLETLTPWKTDEQVSNLRMQQLNDVIYCVEPSTPPMTLARYADDDWRLEALEFSGIPYESSLLNAVRLSSCNSRVNSKALSFNVGIRSAPRDSRLCHPVLIDGKIDAVSGRCCRAQCKCAAKTQQGCKKSFLHSVLLSILYCHKLSCDDSSSHP